MTQVSDFDSILNNIPTVNMGARSANAPLTQSYDKGPDVPLIEATIGDFLMLLFPNILSVKRWSSVIKIFAGHIVSCNSRSIN